MARDIHYDPVKSSTICMHIRDPFWQNTCRSYSLKIHTFTSESTYNKCQRSWCHLYIADTAPSTLALLRSGLGYSLSINTTRCKPCHTNMRAIRLTWLMKNCSIQPLTVMMAQWLRFWCVMKIKSRPLNIIFNPFFFQLASTNLNDMWSLKFVLQKQDLWLNF